ncbi:probable long-chain-alcohol O-fatty-acyltransferase 1 [Mangifera indica]|uniref:probable long-chain-alcohol O-fatty-acyltransferase 1 n=1 Tax=Mangifera indica TaxID=29780 RepID=UPI001CFABB35|nr:probable long-chain-alcohol O-fatty-acyltransferase 1 [Mangifera indica]
MITETSLPMDGEIKSFIQSWQSCSPTSSCSSVPSNKALSPPPSKLFYLISLACLPIKIKQEDEEKSQETPKSTTISPPLPRPVLLGINLALLDFITCVYSYKNYLHQNVLLVLYCCHVYRQLEITLAICAAPIRAIFGFELEPQFDGPHRAASLQDFWSCRWNLMVTSILRSTIYTVTRRVSTHLIGRTWAPLPTVIAVFVVSA